MTESQSKYVELKKQGIIDNAKWNALENIFPGSTVESKLMVLEYCAARKLDPLKRVVHIVPISVLNKETGNYETRDVVMPGIAEIRTTAFRTGNYLGMDKPEYGDKIKYLGIQAPEYCEVVVYRMIKTMRCPFYGRADFSEVAQTKRNKKTGETTLNKIWSEKPRLMLLKVAEADALRRAFPEELGGDFGAEEATIATVIDQPAELSQKSDMLDEQLKFAKSMQNWDKEAGYKNKGD